MHIVLCRIVTGRCRVSSYNVSYENGSESEPKVDHRIETRVQSFTHGLSLSTKPHNKNKQIVLTKNDLNYLVHCRKRKYAHTHTHIVHQYHLKTTIMKFLQSISTPLLLVFYLFLAIDSTPTASATNCSSFHPDYTAVAGGISQAQQVRNITRLINNKIISGKRLRHDPDGIHWIAPTSWKTWNGVPINPCTSTKAQLMAFIFPAPGGVNTMLGLRERFYQVNPFQNNSDPTVAEIENWNIEIIRHFRKLIGFNQTNHPVHNHKCTYLRAAWSEERARSNHWTSKYPGSLNSAYGPCTVPFSSNQHCGAGFLPSPSDQAVYFCPSIATTCIASPAAEGIQAVNTDIPWGIKMSLIIGSFLTSDGIGFHTGPFIGREYFGSGWYMNGASTVFRGKWSGTLNPTCP